MWGVFLCPLLYLGWGRCGLLGEGSGVVELWESLVLWGTPGDLDIPWAGFGSYVGVGDGFPVQFLGFRFQVPGLLLVLRRGLLLIHWWLLVVVR